MSLPLSSRRGVLTRWDDDRGFGFIEPAGGGSRVFVHVSAFPRSRRPTAGSVVTFVEARDERGRPRAVQARLVRGGVVRGRRPLGVVRAGVAVLLLAVALTAAVLAGSVPLAVPLAYLGLSLVTLWAYAADKAAAQQGRWRTSESTLHLLALLGGWPGALVGRQAYHHKTRKQPFTTVVWVTVALNVAALSAYVLRPG